MGTLDYIVKKYNIDLNQELPIKVPIGRFKDMPRLLNELNFKEGAEIGVYEGAYSRILLKQIPGLHLIGVDLWDGYPGFKDYETKDLIQARFTAMENVKGFNCDLMQGWSNEIADRIPDESLDFIFIDGNHAYEWVVWDMYKWIPKVKKGGIVYGHDYDDYTNHRSRWKTMNVVNAVNGYMSSYRISPWFVITNNKNKCWMFVK
jgi:hypothetical protein